MRECWEKLKAAWLRNIGHDKDDYLNDIPVAVKNKRGGK